MDSGHYNTHTISDSDNDSVIVVEDHETNMTTHKDDLPSSPEEPDFFATVLQQHV